MIRPDVMMMMIRRVVGSCLNVAHTQLNPVSNNKFYPVNNALQFTLTSAGQAVTACSTRICNCQEINKEKYSNFTAVECDDRQNYAETTNLTEPTGSGGGFEKHGEKAQVESRKCK